MAESDGRVSQSQARAGRVFQPLALSIARAFRGLSVVELAAKACVARPTVNGIERGTKPPFPFAVKALADALAFPFDYFFTTPVIPSRDVLHFRKTASVPEYAIARALARATIFNGVTTAFGQFAKFVRRLPTAEPKDAEAIERAAEAFRAAVRLRVDAPITNVVQAAEAAGVFVGTFDPEGIGIHGFACALDTNVLMLSTKSCWSRRRFSTLHEVAHLVLHSRTSPDDREEHANRFAGAALVPRAVFWREFPRPYGGRFDWAALIAMKQRWGISLQALVYRAHELGAIDAAQFRTANIHIAKFGWRTEEPAERDPESPSTCAAFVKQLQQRSVFQDLCMSARLSDAIVGEVLGLSVEAPTTNVIPLARRPEKPV